VTAVATLLLAAAVLITAKRPGAARLRALAPYGLEPVAPPVVRPLWFAIGGTAVGALGWAATASPVAGVLSAAAAVGLGQVLRRLADRAERSDDDPVELAGAWEQLAVCLEVGLPVAAAVAAAAGQLDGRTGAELRRVAGLLELGADPAQAWSAVENGPGHHGSRQNGSGPDGSGLAAFARAAARSAGTGAALARTARTEGSRIRAALADAAEARAQRAGVLITAPLGLCFLPAFLVLGIAPVVIGLAGEVLARW
jgi:pilus assembly protein TadC